MENLLLLINDIAFNNSSAEFACYLAAMTRSRLQGVLLAGGREALCAKRTANLEVYAPAAPDKKSVLNPRAGIRDDIRQFREVCGKERVSGTVNCLKGDSLREAVSASRFADLMVVDAAISPDADDNAYLGPFVWALLQAAECPLVIVSGPASEIDEIVLTYDGSASALFAFRRFARLFPCFEHKPVVVVAADRFPDCRHERLIEEQLKPYYTQMHFEALYARDFGSALFDFYQRRNNCFIVMGASGRTDFSRLVPGGGMHLNGGAIGHPVFISHF
ncbi:hypothetical protein [Niabella drilacis]|uniref:Universal stress protein family protein n=1 Tax=Niabella drilacis (strain DSM 25811 / CCM 8410 / CCUG 62505 / LMG 26954 / E90) TaxID=1285928 RepID=A0A1G6RFC2_NIADE|nr:hypothetical protein [Niabella drilacis]SDD02745.1 hypothetical protein SAMN04487894_105247 [Niabella drilacis]